MAEKGVAVKKGKSKPAETESTGMPSIYAPISELRHRMDRMFEDFLNGWHGPRWGRDRWSLEPFEMPSLFTGKRAGPIDVRFDVAESDSGVDITAELPGLDEKDVEVSLADGMLTVKGEKKVEEEKKEKNYHLSERHYGSFMRSFRVPASIDEDQIKASFDKGVLKVSLPKRPEAKSKAKKIPIGKK